MDFNVLTIKGASALLKNKQVSSRELTQDAFAAIEKQDGQIHSFLTLEKDVAGKMAEAADARLAAGKGNALTGIPLGVKDCYLVEGFKAFSASKILDNYESQYEGPAIARLRAESPVFLGKTNTDEFTCGASTENSAYGTTHNPWDLDRVPGGSSGGSAAAVAAGLCLAALGTDTGGSIRQPSSLCGTVGLKNTYGRIPRFGVIPMASSLDTIGAITKTVEDMALMLQVMAGPDSRDATTPNAPIPNYSALLGKDIKGLKVGVPKEYFVEGMEAGVEQSVREGIKELEKLGAQIVDISLPYTKYAIPVYYLIVPSEVSSNMARFDAMRYGPRSKDAADVLEFYLENRGMGFGPEMKRRIMIGTHALSSGYYDAYYIKAQKVRTLIRQDFEQAFKNVDVIVTPTSPTTAFKIGAKNDDPLQMYLADIFTVSINLAGVPALNVPCGFSQPADGERELPVGMQIIGPNFSEDRLLQVGHAFEQATEWHQRKAQI